MFKRVPKIQTMLRSMTPQIADYCVQFIYVEFATC